MTSTNYTTPAQDRIEQEARGLLYFATELVNDHAPAMLEKARTADTPQGRTYWAAGVVQWRGVLWTTMGKLADLDALDADQRATWVRDIDGMVTSAAQAAGITPEALEELDADKLPKP